MRCHPVGRDTNDLGIDPRIRKMDHLSRHTNASSWTTGH